MGWKQYVRHMEADRRRAAQDQVRWQRQMEKRHKELAKQAALTDAAREVGEFEAYLDTIVSLHRDCGDAWDWRSLAKAPQPVAPERASTKESTAQERLAGFRPGFFARTFGGAANQRRMLESEVERARAEDQAAYDAALRDHAQLVEVWRVHKSIGSGMVMKDPASYRRAIEHVDPYEGVVALGTTVTLEAIESDVLAIRCAIDDPELVPTEEVKLTSAGKLSTKAMADGKRFGLYQDYVCSCALRLARETFALLPVERVIVNVGERRRLNTATGHYGPATILSVHFERRKLTGLNFSTLDASDSMQNFQNRMKFKKSTGFEEVEPITIHDNWIST